MSNEENENQTVENTATPEVPKRVADNILSNLMDLKDKNPKVFLGAVGGVALLIIIIIIIIIMMMGGGDSKTVSGPVIKNLVVGQQYVLKSANAYDKDATVRLVAVPGTIAAYDDTEEADRNGACQHMPQGTAVTILELQDAYGKKNAYSKVQIEEGECKGNSGWALSIDVQ
ncbi:MAG: hypothetical protein PHH59_08525 [Methylovulum sp.]|uniref:hypothetical protein n=1 Tax=Methylovulum sp. TaxID=1916980 RepID=UPI0026133EBE|nr:hypothetical protein [Methylovulum sp.]MDD2724046.1 hypothetical protein [Methylovulum sp.]MDD5124181.1 hypothetical protein [Methylovulum sp.]